MIWIALRVLFRCKLWLAGLLLIAVANATCAQSIAVSKDLCGPNGVCISQQGSSPSVPPNSTVSYVITLYNNHPTNAVTVDLQETFQPGFHFLPPSDCGQDNPPLTGGNVATFFGPLALPPGTTICVIHGYFDYLPASQNNANNVVTVYDHADTSHQTALGISNLVNAVVDGTAPLPTDVEVDKIITSTSVDPVTGAVTVHYAITITNFGPSDVYGFLLQDRLSVPANGVPLVVTYGSSSCNIVPVPGSGPFPGSSPGPSTCFVPGVINSPVTVSAATPADFVQWNFPSGTGLLKAGDSMQIEYDVIITSLPNLNCVIDPQGNLLHNEAHISFNVPGSGLTIQDSNPANNTAMADVPITIDAPVDPTCGTAALQVRKTLDTVDLPGGFPWGTTLGYTITLRNTSSTQTIGNISLFDTINGSLGDLVQAGVGTPPFTAELVSWTCPAGVCTSPQVPTGNTQQVTGYGDTRWMFGTTVYAPPNSTDLAPHAQVSFKLWLKFSDPGCDSYPEIGRKPVLNFVRASYTDTALGVVTVESQPVTAEMQPLPACQFTVQKAVDNGLGKIAFEPPPAPVSYTVTFSNPTPQVATIGTLIDTLRIVQPNYATQLPVDYSYSCTASPAGAVSGYPTGGTGLVTAIHTSLPQQGVRIIQNTTPVVFQLGAILTCAVTLKVSRPSPGDANCARVGELENAAIMDTSAFYNPNLAWPSGTAPGNAASVSLPLPQCLNLVVNKSVTPIWTTENGGPLNYTLTITNVGNPILATDGVTLSDAFTPNNYAASVSGTTVCNNPSTCTIAPAWTPGLTANPATLHVNSLDQGQSIITSFPVSSPYPSPAPPPPGKLCNHAGATVTGLPATDWYAKDPSTWQTDLCTPIFETRPLEIKKVVSITPPATVPPVATFTVNVTCSYLVNGVQYGPNATVGFTYPPAPAIQTVPDIPVGSVCSIAEQQPLPTPVAMSTCPSGFGAWGAVAYTNSVGPDGTTQSLTIVTSSPNLLEVKNTFACLPVGSLQVTKTFDPASPASQFPATSVFPVEVACTGRPTTVVNLTSPGFQQLVPDILMGSVCTITELPPIGTDVQQTCQWHTSYPLGQSATITNGNVSLEAHNSLSCTGTLYVYKTFEPTSLGASMPAAALFPVTIACPPAFTSTVNLGSGNQYVYQTPSMPMGTVCTITELTPLNAPIPSNCQWATTNYPKNQSVTIPNGTASLVAENSLTCGPPADASLAINKTTSNLSPIMMPNPQFPVTVDCQPGGPITTLSLTPNGNTLTAGNIPIGANCTITETLPQMVPPTPSWCEWQPSLIWGGVSHPNGSQMMNVVGLPDPRSIEVHNDFVCITPDPDSVGDLLVKKTITYDTMDITNHPLGDFEVLVSCVNPVSNHTITLSYANNYQASVLNLPVGADCTVVETLPQSPSVLPAGSQWVATYPAGQQITIQPGSQTVPLRNERMNNSTLPTESQLEVQKNFSIHGAYDPNHTMTFQVITNCINAGGLTVSGYPMTVNLTPSFTSYLNGSIGEVGYSAWTDFNVPVGSTCTVSEPTLPPLSADLSTCSWVAGTPEYTHRGYGGSVAPGGSIMLTVAQQGYRLSVNNLLVCPPILIVNPGDSTTGERLCPAGSITRSGKCVLPADPVPDTAIKPEQARQRYDLGIKLTSPGEWFPGLAGVTNLVVTNYGAMIAPPLMILLNDRFPAEIKPVRAAGKGWRCDSSTPVTCTYNARVARGQSLPSLVITAVAARLGKFEHCASVSLQGAQDVDKSNDRDCLTVRVSSAKTGDSTTEAPAFVPRTKDKPVVQKPAPRPGVVAPNNSLGIPAPIPIPTPEHKQ